ncbi:WD40 repeat domain-containing protein [Candidatus Uabimicrobium amorphum]|uniref:Uncharacterized protein n=1 Tax=Uabimicrobium amorphum TaxID=2596890 RepID=A0A5S9F5D9_UABAM|nr:WD40 repeat domain-containing protein [Candidatus Uabimicrobium amorphum]BBM86498.1 hypothetical protein UABAM_04884 [Candidatus Uabimicrobium amorphum]
MRKQSKIIKFASVIVLSLALVSCAKNIPVTPITGVAAFTGRALIGVSDADMINTAYADGKLGNRSGLKDTMTFVPLPLNPENSNMQTISTPNSVISWPQIVDVSKDGAYAFVVETKGTPPQETKQFDDVYSGFPDGSLLTVVSLRNKLQVTDQKKIGLNPSAIMVSPNKNLLAITTDGDGRELCLVGFANGQVENIYPFHIPTYKNEHFRGGARSVAWHPSGNYIALNIGDREVAFYKIVYNEKGVPQKIEPFGNKITTGKYLTMGSFTPDGNFFLISDVAWGDSQLSYLFNPRGTLTSIAFGEKTKYHCIVSRKEVGYSPEGFAMSPDGKLVVTVNINRTYLPSIFPATVWPYRERSSLTLLTFDRETGRIKVIAEYGFDGLLPENATFDASGKNLAVAIYHNREEKPREGFIEFWNVTKKDNYALERTGYKIPCMRGIHDLVLVP